MSEDSAEDKRKKICNLLAEHSGLCSKEIALALNMEQSEVEFHLRVLLQAREIQVAANGDQRRFQIKQTKIKPREKRAGTMRSNIISLVQQQPGLHLSKIAELLHISIPLADYHISVLMKDGTILAVRDAQGYYKRYYLVKSGVSAADKKILEALRKKVPFTIILFLLKYHTLQHKQMMNHLHLSSSTLSYHLTNLAESGIVDVHTQGIEKGYFIKNRQDIVRILKKYGFHLEAHLTMEGVKSLWDEFDYGNLTK